MCFLDTLPATLPRVMPLEQTWTRSPNAPPARVDMSYELVRANSHQRSPVSGRSGREIPYKDRNLPYFL